MILKKIAEELGYECYLSMSKEWCVKFPYYKEGLADAIALKDLVEEAGGYAYIDAGTWTSPNIYVCESTR